MTTDTDAADRSTGEPDTGLRSVHHIGITVADVERTLAFWEAFLGKEATWRRLLDGTYLEGITGYPGIQIDGAMIELPGGLILEALDYQTSDRVANPPATANPGNVHICLETDDIDVSWQRAIDAGAVPTSAAPVTINSGPNIGTRAGYLRDPDGITVELFQVPPTPNDDRRSDT